jgi:hypothetical protein
MNRFLKLLRDSVLGRELVAEARKGGDAQIASYSKQIKSHEAERDQRVAELLLEQRQAAVTLEGAKTELQRLQTKHQELLFKVNIGCPGQADSLRRECEARCKPLREAITELQASMAELDA